MSVDLFLRLGDQIKGESIDDGKDNNSKPLKDQIDILAWSWSGTQAGTTHNSTGGGSGKASFSDIAITKYVDLSSNEIVKHLANGKHIPTATLTVRKAGGDNPLIYYTIDMEEVLVTSYATGGGGDGMDRLTENLSLNFARFKITYKRQNEQGGEAGKTQAGWNIPKNVAW